MPAVTHSPNRNHIEANLPRVCCATGTRAAFRAHERWVLRIVAPSLKDGSVSGTPYLDLRDRDQSVWSAARRVLLGLPSQPRPKRRRVPEPVGLVIAESAQ